MSPGGFIYYAVLNTVTYDCMHGLFMQGVEMLPKYNGYQIPGSGDQQWPQDELRLMTGTTVLDHHG